MTGLLFFYVSRLEGPVSCRLDAVFYIVNRKTVLYFTVFGKIVRVRACAQCKWTVVDCCSGIVFYASQNNVINDTNEDKMTFSPS